MRPLPPRPTRSWIAVFVATTIAAVQPAIAAEDPREEAVQIARQGRLAEAIERLQAIAGRSSDIRVSFDLIAILGWAGRHREAMAIWQSLPAGTELPDYIRPELILGLLEIGELDKADSLAAQWLARAPGHVPALIA